MSISMTLRTAIPVFLISILASLPAWADLSVNAKSVILVDANTGKVLYKKNDTEPRAVASTQKLLTALIVAEAGNLDAQVVVETSDTQCEPTKLYIKPGQRFTRRELLTALLVKSTNDVARALARDNAGSQSAFAEKMNARMLKLGGTNSHFVTANGLPATGQHSTARDMARVARAAYRNSTLRDIMAKKSYTFRFPTGKEVLLTNTNRLLRSYSFCNGMKTGYTHAAGHCLISSGTHNGRDVIAILLGSTKGIVATESAKLLAYGLNMTSSQIDASSIASH
jgi:serine-type D-Ala-D-Ala carboxypeptidase (penicillin-binding protein 5/6)